MSKWADQFTFKDILHLQKDLYPTPTLMMAAARGPPKEK